MVTRKEPEIDLDLLMKSHRPQQCIRNMPFFDPENKLKRFASWGYTPTPQQWEAHKSKATFLGLFAGARFGKTLFAANETLDYLMYPGAKIWLCGASFEHCRREFDQLLLLAARGKFPNGKCLIDYLRVVQPARGQAMIKTPWGSGLWTKATDGSNAKRNLGESLDLIVLCEGDLINLNTFHRYLVPRLSDRQGRVILPSTPACDHGIAKYFQDRWKAGDPFYECFQYSVLDNPFIDKARIELLKSQMSEDDYREQVLGEIVHRVGFVFPEFRDDLHIFDEFANALEHLPTLIGIRFRFSEPSCLVALKFDRKTKSAYIYEEYVTKTSDPKLLKQRIQDISAACFKVVGCIAGTNDQLTVQEMRRVGVNVLSVDRSEKSVMRNLIMETSAIKAGFQLAVPGAYHLQVAKRCEKTIQEIKSTRWPNSKDLITEARQDIPVLNGFLLSRCAAHCLMFLGDNK